MIVGVRHVAVSNTSNAEGELSGGGRKKTKKLLTHLHLRSPLYLPINDVTCMRSCDGCERAGMANSINSRGSVEYNEFYLVCYLLCFSMFYFKCCVT